MTNGYLSQDRAHLARLQRQRRARMSRIDYMPGPKALAVIQTMREKARPGSVAATNSAVIDAIVTEWAALAGINKPELIHPSRPHAPAYESGATSGPKPELSDQYARAYDFGTARTLQRPAMCGATRHRDGQPCQAKPEPGKRRCRFHGGRSTGPRTVEGKARALANLMQNRRTVGDAGSGYTPAC